MPTKGCDTQHALAIVLSLHVGHSGPSSSVVTARRLSALAQRRLWTALAPTAFSMALLWLLVDLSTAFVYVEQQTGMVGVEAHGDLSNYPTYLTPERREGLPFCSDPIHRSACRFLARICSGTLVQPSAMAAVLSPAQTYSSSLSKAVIDKDLCRWPSSKVVVYACQLHGKMLLEPPQTTAPAMPAKAATAIRKPAALHIDNDGDMIRRTLVERQQAQFRLLTTWQVCQGLHRT